MESLPDDVIDYILSHINNARDVAILNCVSKRWKDSTRYLKSLRFPSNSFDKLSQDDSPDSVVRKMLSSSSGLEELVVYSPFSADGLASWLSLVGSSLRQLELRIDYIVETQTYRDSQSKMDCIGAGRNLESLKLWGVLMGQPPKWGTFEKLKNLEIVGAKLNLHILNAALKSCPFLTSFILLGCEGGNLLSINLPLLEFCKLDIYGSGNCFLFLICPKIETLEVQGCSWIRVRETEQLRNLTIAHRTGKVFMVDIGNLPALEFLSLSGIQWSWDAICHMLHFACEVKHLFMKIEFIGDHETYLPCPEVDFVDFFNNHPKLAKFDIDGAMFAAVCQNMSLKHVHSGFQIPFLEEVVVTVRSPGDVEMQMSTLKSLLKCGKNLKTMVIKILQMNSSSSGVADVDEIYHEICQFRDMNPRIVKVE